MKRMLSSALILLAFGLLAGSALAEETAPVAQSAPTEAAAVQTECADKDEAGAAAADQIVATTEGPHEYVVRRGDTLWDISQRFFDTPWVWPKLWEQNRGIGNPHRIKPGMKLLVYPGMFDLPPEPAPVAAVAPAPEPIQPPEPKLFHPTVRDIGYLSPDKAETVGTIFGAQDHLKLTLGEGDKAFVRFPGPAPAVGTRFRVVHISEEVVRHPVTHEPLGYKHTFPAVLEVVEVKEDVATAAVTDSSAEIAVGDGVVPWFPMPEAVALKRGGPRAEGRLVAAQDWRYRIGPGHLVFLDLGSGDGLEPGQVMSIWREAESDGLSLSDLEATRLGEMVVVLVRPDTATAMVTNSLTELTEGDIVRPEP